MTMFAALFRTRITAVWCLLILATIASWEFGHGVGFTDLRHAGLAVIVVSFVKVRFVVLDFMELRHAPPAMRWAVEAWAVIVCAGLCGLYWWRPVFGG